MVMHVWGAHIHVCACAHGGWRLTLGASPQALSTLILELGSHWPGALRRPVG